MTSSVDIEDPITGAVGTGSHKGSLDLALKTSSGLLLTWSILAMIEGAIRLVRVANPTGGLNPPDAPIPPAALLAGGIAEVIFGSAGLLLAVGIFVFGLRSRGAVMAFLGLQAVCGWFVFLLYVIAVPIKSMVDLEEGILGMSVGLSRFNIFLGMVTSIVWCAALQSGQFTFALVTLSLLKGNYVKQSKTRLRAVVWSALAAIAGFSMALAGITLTGNLSGSAPYLRPDIAVFPPHVAIYPVVILCCGVLTLCWGLTGVAGAMTTSSILLAVFHYCWFFAFMANVITFGLVLGKEPDGFFAFASAQHVLLSLVFTLLPVVFTQKLIGEHSVAAD